MRVGFVVLGLLAAFSVVAYAMDDLGRAAVLGAAEATFALGLLPAGPRSTLAAEVRLRAAIAMTPVVVVVLVWPAAAVLTFAEPPTLAGIGFLVTVFCMTGFGLTRVGGRIAEWRLPWLVRRGPWHEVSAACHGELATLTLPDGAVFHAALPVRLLDEIGRTGTVWLAGPPAGVVAVGYPDHRLITPAHLKPGASVAA
ncbi:hypothetical protein [Actinokineospora globicatena]|uniref:hypothetical protein n=1 Tax=Actinokineospora globicatena TaxID=103729 RepID=UPI0020A378B2|nr:hypothetical protein [Actinokineospora globicatena]MCP2305400.1 hypothetical protein [Actinokineospora globicatena]